jgi:Na+-transporting NADH:ubiquinone oxidoreductase subunit NqrB
MAKSSPRGASRVLVALYAVLALAASARGIYELIVKFQLAPLSYSLSLVSALVYIVATIALANASKPRWHRIASTTIGFELVGVICVGILSFSSPALFAHPSVWSWFGAGYGCLPLALPIIGLLWLRRHQAN